ncbi:MAG: hypothetical protein ACUZ8H_09880 [Candidatus Anammoxibacter sp.]
MRVIIARTKETEAIDAGIDAGRVKKHFHPKEDWIGKLTLWDGDNFEFEFTKEI